MYPDSYKPWAMRMTSPALRRNLLPASCCSELVMNGALGDLRYGFSSSDRTARSLPVNAAASASARSLVTTATPSLAMPFSSKSRPLATRMPLSIASVALNDGVVAVTAARSQ